MFEEHISVIIPAFNEESRILPTICSVMEYLNKNFRRFEIIVIDDGSCDDTVQQVESVSRDDNNIRLVKNSRNSGKGFSIRNGVMDAAGSLVLACDADLSTPIEEVEKLMYWLGKGFDIAIGSRALNESEIIIKQPWYRQKMGSMFNVLVQLFLLRGFRDTQCGFKLFKRAVARNIFKQGLIDGFSYDIEILLIAEKMGYRIKEVPVRWLNSPDSRVRVMVDPFSMIAELIRIKSYSMRGLYGMKGKN